MKRLIALIGDYYHAEGNIRQSLEAIFDDAKMQTGYSLTIVQVEQLLEELQSKTDCLILCKENRYDPTVSNPEVWMNSEVEKAIIQYVQDGGSIIAWHSGLANYGADSQFTKMLGGYFEYHPKNHEQVTYEISIKADVQTNGQTDGLTNQANSSAAFDELAKSFTIVDEHYFTNCFHNSTEVYLTSTSIDGKSTAGWRHPFGKGKVCCFTPAHRLEGLLATDVKKKKNQEKEK